MKELVVKQEKEGHAPLRSKVIGHRLPIYYHAFGIGMFYSKKVEKIKYADQNTLYPINPDNTRKTIGMEVEVPDAINIQGHQ